jgi:AraC-like DNA-binding protein
MRRRKYAARWIALYFILTSTSSSWLRADSRSHRQFGFWLLRRHVRCIPVRPAHVVALPVAQLAVGGCGTPHRACQMDESDMVVKSGNVATAGAALGHMDLALWLIRSVSPALASLTARYLIVDSRPSQTAYALTDHLVHSDPVIQLFERWARARLTHRFSLDSAAKAVGASKRTLTRRLQSVLGKSPMSYFQSLRVERAVHLLKTSKASVEEIAAKVGYHERWDVATPSATAAQSRSEGDKKNSLNVATCVLAFQQRVSVATSRVSNLCWSSVQSSME